jgi:hypothetical protein
MLIAVNALCQGHEVLPKKFWQVFKLVLRYQELQSPVIFQRYLLFLETEVEIPRLYPVTFGTEWCHQLIRSEKRLASQNRIGHKGVAGITDDLDTDPSSAALRFRHISILFFSRIIRTALCTASRSAIFPADEL